MTGVLIAADEAAVREAVQLAVEGAGRRIAGVCAAGPAAVELARATDPDVVVLAWTALDPNKVDLLSRVRSGAPEARIVVSCPGSPAGAALLALEAGADRYVESRDLADLLAAVEGPAAPGEPGSETVIDLREPDLEHRPQLRRDPGPYRALVVDDDPTARQLIRLSLELEGAAVTEAASLTEARLVLAADFDGVVLDRCLPDGDGLDLLPVLAKRYPQASVVVCSSVNDHAEPWFVLHVAKTDMESVVRGLGLVPAPVDAVGPVQEDDPDVAIGTRLRDRQAEIVRRWTASLSRRPPDQASSTPGALIAQLVQTLRQRDTVADAGRVAPGPDERRDRAELTVRQLAELRELITLELSRQLSPDDRGRPLADVNRDLDNWILALHARDIDRLQQQAWTDPLTGLLNRWAFNDALMREVARSARYHRPFSVVTADLDGLKAINDRDGHLAGDAALLAMATAIRSALRLSDGAYRVGGDEFVILLPETPKPVVAEVICRIQAGGAPSFSWGAATYLEDSDDSETVVGLADQQLVGRRHASRTMPEGL